MVKELIFGIVGGLGLFIYGIWVMSDGLQKICGERMRKILAGLTNNPIKGAMLSAGITSLTQSSSATTVMVIGFVNASIMTLNQALGVVFGANIGTTITAQIIAFKLTDYSLPVIGIGMVLLLLAKKKKYKNIAGFILGFGMLFLGLSIMTQAVKPLGGSPIFNEIFINFSKYPILGILAAAAVTAITQSSSVTTGMVLSLAMADLIDLRAAIPLILGCNVGTCVTALLASIGANITAKRVALAHILFNVIGVVIFFPFIPVLYKIAIFTSGYLPRQIANVHTLFNVATTIIFMPFISKYAVLLCKIIKGKGEEEIDSMPKYLDSHLLSTPPIAIDAVKKETVRTLGLTKRMINLAMLGYYKNDPRPLDKVTRGEEAVDSLREAVTNYLVDLMEEELNREESAKIPALLHIINDVERIGDHAENLKDLAEQKMDRGTPLSDKAMEEARKMHDEIIKMLDSTSLALKNNDIVEAKRVLKYETHVNQLREIFKDNHVRRLEQRDCNVLSNMVFLDLISNFEKIGDHLFNVAQKVIDGLQWSDTPADTASHATIQVSHRA
ncbi:Na/Pi cotransporter family protein [Candidatus Auribacterota bacterium]